MYSVTIKSNNKALQHAKEKGYSFVFAKGVSHAGRTHFNSAWIVIPPNKAGNTVKVSWDVKYQGSFTTTRTVDGAKIDIQATAIDLDAGCYYQVDQSGVFMRDINKDANPSIPGFIFNNNRGYDEEYIPVILTKDHNGDVVPIWAADTGVSRNGTISATPVEVVRVWFGAYKDSGTSVIADYATQVVEFNLTDLYAASATINDDLSQWDDLSANAKTITD